MKGESVPSKLSITLLALLAIYAFASLVHFIHNAEFLSAYPGLPLSWTRVTVYLAWLGITAVGALGVLLLFRGYSIVGLAILAVYALLGIDSLGHYLVAPFHRHTAAMNITVLFEVAAGALVLLEVIRQAVAQVRQRSAT
jgi:hypothetical protein